MIQGERLQMSPSLFWSCVAGPRNSTEMVKYSLKELWTQRPQNSRSAACVNFPYFGELKHKNYWIYLRLRNSRAERSLCVRSIWSTFLAWNPKTSVFFWCVFSPFCSNLKLDISVRSEFTELLPENGFHQEKTAVV